MIPMKSSALSLSRVCEEYYSLKKSDIFRFKKCQQRATYLEYSKFSYRERLLDCSLLLVPLISITRARRKCRAIN